MYSPLQTLEPIFGGVSVQNAVIQRGKIYLNRYDAKSYAYIYVGGFSMSFGSKIFSGSWVTSLQI